MARVFENVEAKGAGWLWASRRLRHFNRTRRQARTNTANWGKPNMNGKRERGFNLTELMVVVAAIGILAAIAYPSYQNYVRETRRAQAQAALTQASSQQEQYFLNFKNYAGAMTTMNMPTTTEGGFYNLAVDSASVTNFVLSATPVGIQTRDSCGTLTLSKSGTKTPATGCW